MKLSGVVAGCGLGLALVVGLTAGVTSLHKDVIVEVDGKATPSATFALTVGDVLAAQNITLEPGDIVTPSVETPAADGQVITIALQKQVRVDVDGEEQLITTNAATVAEALTEVKVDELATADVSLPLTSQLAEEGASLVITTEKDVKVTVAGESEKHSTTSRTVADLFAELNVNYDDDDRISPALDTLLEDGMKVKLDRVEISEETLEEVVEYPTEVEKSSSLWVSETRIKTAGKDGLAKRTYKVTKVNGEEEKREVVTETVITEPVTQVELHGTKMTSQGVKINLARAAMWDKIAKCESGGRWNINTGNGYYGGLQFSKASWNANGGRDFAAYPHQASRAEQITIANRYYAKAGLKPWSCRRVV